MDMEVKQIDTGSIEDSLSRFRSILLVIKFFVRAEYDHSAETEKLIKQLSGSKSGDCIDIHSVVGSPSDTEYYSCKDSELSEINSDVNESCQRRNGSYRKVSLEWIFVISNLLLELVSVTFDQLSSPRKSQYALIGMVTSFASMVICITEIFHEGREEKVTWKRRGNMCWFYHPAPSHKPFGTFKKIFGLVCAIFQSIFATIIYVFYCEHDNNPIKISFLPAVFAFCLLCSKFCDGQDRVDGDQTVEDGSLNKIV